MDAEFPSYTPAERRADAVLHAVGLTLGPAACAALAAVAMSRPDAGPRLLAGLGLYAAGLMAMLACSALYNLAGEAAPARKRLLRRLYLVNKLVRSYAALVETLDKHRGKGQQVVRVEHVTVNAGGQASVGAVSQGGGYGAACPEATGTPGSVGAVGRDAAAAAAGERAAEQDPGAGGEGPNPHELDQ